MNLCTPISIIVGCVLPPGKGCNGRGGGGWGWITLISQGQVPGWNEVVNCQQTTLLTTGEMDTSVLKRESGRSTPVPISPG